MCAAGSFYADGLQPPKKGLLCDVVTVGSVLFQFLNNKVFENVPRLLHKGDAHKRAFIEEEGRKELGSNPKCPCHTSTRVSQRVVLVLKSPCNFMHGITSSSVYQVGSSTKVELATAKMHMNDTH